MADAIDGAAKVVVYTWDATAGKSVPMASNPVTGLKVSLGTLISGENTRHNVIQTTRYCSYEHISSTAAGTIAAVTCGATGSAGDILERLIVVNTIAATNRTTISGNGNETVPVLPNQLATATYTLDLGLVSVSAGWRITPATGQDVLAIGYFT